MELTVFERAVLINVLPKEGNFKTLRTLKNLREGLALSDPEVKLYQPEIDGTTYNWRQADEKGNPIPQEAEIEVTEIAKELVADILRELDEKEVLQEQHYTLYEKFVGGD